MGSAQDVTGIRLDGVESAIANLQNRVDEAPDQPNVSEAIITVKQAAEGVRRAIDEVFSTVDCG